MALTRLRIVGATAVCALMLAGTVSAGNVAPKAPQYGVSQSAARGYVRVADLFGESDEEKAARQQHKDGQDAQIRTLHDKVRDLEETVSRLTGQNEELSHRISELSEKIDRQQKDFEYRLCALAAQQLGSASGRAIPTPCHALVPVRPPACLKY